MNLLLPPILENQTRYIIYLQAPGLVTGSHDLQTAYLDKMNYIRQQRESFTFTRPIFPSHPLEKVVAGASTRFGDYVEARFVETFSRGILTNILILNDPAEYCQA